MDILTRPNGPVVNGTRITLVITDTSMPDCLGAGMPLGPTLY